MQNDRQRLSDKLEGSEFESNRQALIEVNDDYYSYIAMVEQAKGVETLLLAMQAAGASITTSMHIVVHELLDYYADAMDALVPDPEETPDDNA